MPIKPLKAAQEILSHDSCVVGSGSETLSYLMDLLYYGDFRIFQQIASTGVYDFVNLVGTKGPAEGEPPLWLISTLATGHPPTPATWSRTGGRPLTPTYDSEMGLLYGLGATSGKIDFVSKLLAASSFASSELNRPLYVIGLLGNESHGTGLASVLNLSGGEGGQALISAPTNLELWAAHPGLVVLRVELARVIRHRRMPPIRGIFRTTTRGRSAHCQWPGLGKNALDEAFKVLARLRAQGDIRVLSIQTEKGPNRIPGHCELIVATSFETLPDLGPDTTVEALGDGATVPFPIDGLLHGWERAQRAISKAFATFEGATQQTPTSLHFGELISDRDAIAGTLSFWFDGPIDVVSLANQVAEVFEKALPRAEELSVSIDVVQNRPAFHPSQRSGSTPSPFLATARSALSHQHIPPVVSKGLITTDAGLLQQEGIEAYAFGPGTSGALSLRDNEYVPAAHIEAAYTFYVNLIRRWCLKKA